MLVVVGNLISMKYLYVIILICLFIECSSPNSDSENEVITILITDRYDTLDHYKKLLPKRFELIEADLLNTKTLIANAKILLSEKDSDYVKNYIIENVKRLNSIDANNLVNKLVIEKASNLTTTDLQVIELELLNTLQEDLFETDLRYINTLMPLVTPASYKIKNGDKYKADVFMVFVRPEFSDKVLISGDNFNEFEIPRSEHDLFSFELGPDQYKEGENSVKLKYVLNDDIHTETLTNEFIFVVE